MPHLARYSHAAIDDGQVHFGAGSPYGWRRPTDEEWTKHDAAEAEFLRVVNGIDWDRVLLEAIGRHMFLEHPNDKLPQRWLSYEIGGEEAPGVCGECIFACLIQRGSNLSDWEKSPWGSEIQGGDVAPTSPYRPRYDKDVEAGKVRENDPPVYL